MKQFQITSRARHLRYIFFVDEHYPYEKLFKLICHNQRFWGGRFNPIIPVSKSNISKKYSSLLSYYDPDYVFYSKEVDPETIKQLRVFNPHGYYSLDEMPRKQDISGVDALNFLSQLDSKTKVILPSDLWKTESILLDYYKLNFGLESNGIMSDHAITKDNPQTIITKENYLELNKIIHLEKPVNQAHLSRRNINTRILRDLKHARYNDFEIVIARDKTSNSDLIYFWNRLLYQGENVLYVTVEELTLLSQDKFFGAVLYDMSAVDTVYVTSTTLNKSEIEELITQKLRPIAFHRRFQYKSISDFPFDILDAHGFSGEYGENVTTQTLVSEKGLLQVQKPSFTNKVGAYAHKWAVDIEIKQVDEHYYNRIEFPFTTDTRFIVKGVEGRITRNRNISVFLHNDLSKTGTLNISIPEFKYLLRQLICRPLIDGETQETKYVDIGPHDSSNRLFAFLKSFNFDFTAIDDFFTDKFWNDLFEELITNERIVGDTISFDEVKSKAIVALKEKGLEFGKKGETYLNEENLELGLKRTIKELCDYRVFLKGFSLKCNKCSSEFWYPIKEVNETVNCKGCLEDFDLPIEPKFSYKVNDLIKNNIYQSKENRDGNLTVIRTLVSMNRRSNQSFAYSPQINLYDDHYSNKPCAEIDVVCLSNGELIIGEAKHNSSAFSAESNKSLKSLVEIAKAIRPDVVLLSCYEDPNGKLEKAKKGLMHIFNKWEYQPRIETLLLHPADDFHLGNHRYFYY
jgi:hypothetical protein